MSSKIGVGNENGVTDNITDVVTDKTMEVVSTQNFSETAVAAAEYWLPKKEYILFMEEKVPSLKTGVSWFRDLTTADTFYILPFLSLFSFWLTMECHMPEGLMKNFARGFAVLIIPLCAGFPKELKLIQSPPYELEHVEIVNKFNISELSVHVAAVDVVLWCCRPRSLTLELNHYIDTGHVVKMFTFVLMVLNLSNNVLPYVRK
ncbi:mitochondrial inner membrane protein OXA1-like protein [Tanacetum coccineum]